VLHDYIDFEVGLVDVAVIVAHDVLMLQVSEDVDFCYYLLLLLLIHLAVVQLFGDHDAAICLPLDFSDSAETTFSNVFNFFVLVHAEYRCAIVY
jgi:hypothetical protein